MISEFFLSSTGCHTKAKDPSLPYNFTRSWTLNSWIHSFRKCISALLKCKQSCPGFELWSSCLFPKTLTNTLKTTPCIQILISPFTIKMGLKQPATKVMQRWTHSIVRYVTTYEQRLYQTTWDFCARLKKVCQS